MRKDAKCFFGRLKRRVRILKLGFLFREWRLIDTVYFTCCILYKILHGFDGLKELEEGVHWKGVDGLNDACVADPLRDGSAIARVRGVLICCLSSLYDYAAF